MARICRRGWRSPGAETLMTDNADSVGELCSTGRRVTDCRAIKQRGLVEVEQALLGVARLAVHELRKLT
jgi:hypothetical protein